MDLLIRSWKYCHMQGVYYDLRTKCSRVMEQVKFSVPEYWIVNPDQKTVEVYTAANGKFSLSSEAEGTGTIQSTVFPDFSANIPSIFP